MLKERYIEFKANKFREEHGITATEAIDVYKLLKKLNVITVFKDLSDKFSGMAIKTGSTNFMLVNSGDIKARQHFTIGHELYHLFIQENFTNRMCKVGEFDKKDREEYNADWFSSYLLMPENGLLEYIPKEEFAKDRISLDTIVKIEQQFSVSRIAVLNRLLFLELITKTKKEELKKDVIKSALMLGYSDALYKNSNSDVVIGDYGERAKNLYDRDLLSENDFYNLMIEIGIDLDQNFDEDVKAEG
jgi:Zn-dependent peptidase ImmA (M78 family)